MKRFAFLPVVAKLFLSFLFLISLTSTLLAQPLTQVACPGFVASRLVVGQQARVLPGDANNVRSRPDSGAELTGQIPAGAAFIVLEGPTCANGYAWWRVDYNGLVGWTVEGSGDQYWLEPAGVLPSQAPTLTATITMTPSGPELAACPGFLPSRLIVGERGRVLPGDANNMRTEADSNAQLVIEIPGGATFTVLEGPLCIGGMAWWRVDYVGRTGWTAEGLNDVYWLEPAGPIPTQAPTLTPSITNTPQPTWTPSPTPTVTPVPVPIVSFSGVQEWLSAPLPDTLEPITADNLTRLQPLSLVGRGGVGNIAWSPDGQTIAVANGLGVWLNDASAPENQIGSLLPIPELRFGALEFSPDSTLLALGSVGYTENIEPTLQVWNIETGERVFRLGDVREGISAVAFSPDGALLASGSMDGKVRLWNMDTGDEIGLVEEHVGSVYDLAFSADGTQLASVGADSFVTVYNVARREHQIDYESQGGIYDVAYSPDGSFLVAAGGGGDGSNPGVLRVWDVVTSQRVISPIFEQELDSVAFSPDGATLAIMGFGRDQVWLWDVSAREVASVLELPVTATNMIFKPSESALAISHRDGTVRLWDIETAEQETLLDYETRATDRAAISPDGDLLAMASGDGVLLWDTHTREVTETFNDFTGTVNYLHFNTEGSELWFTITNRQGESRYIWNLQTNEQTLSADAFPPLPDTSELMNTARTYVPTGRNTIRAVTLVPGTSILVINDAVSLHFWDMTGRVPLFRAQYLCDLPGGSDLLGFSADGTVMFTRNTGVVWLWGVPG